MADELCRQLGLHPATALRWDKVEAGQLPPGTKIQRDNPIFPRVDLAALEAKAAKLGLQPMYKPGELGNMRTSIQDTGRIVQDERNRQSNVVSY